MPVKPTPKQKAKTMLETKAKKKTAPKKKTVKEKAPDKMLQFAEEYIIDWNGTRAYKEIYGKEMKDETAASAASRLLRNVKVCSEIERLLSSVKNRRNERKQRVIEELEAIAYDPLAVDISYDKEGEILEVSRRDKIKCLELLGKTEALFTDKVEHTGHIELNIDSEDASLL